MNNTTPVRMPCSIQGKACYVVWKNQFIIDERYVPIRALGRGAYGMVMSARDQITGEKVAIKKINAVFENPIVAWRTLREVKLLRHLQHENVIGLRDIMRPADCQIADFGDIYLVYELMDTDLHQIIRSGQHLSDQHLQYFIYQVLRGLKYVHTANVLHRDLKPANLLLTASCELKICDFGLARTSSERNVMTEYVVTRWYRAPELLLSCDQYTAAIDVWSVGCILAELLKRRPLFPGKNYLDQLNLIVGKLGKPSEAELGFVTQWNAKQFIRDHAPAEPCDWAREFPHAKPACIDLLNRMLQFDPRRRITVEQALQHPYLADMHDEACEMSAPAAFEFDLENEKLSQAAETAAATAAAATAHGDPAAVQKAKRAVAEEIALVRQRMWEEIQGYHRAAGKLLARNTVNITATAVR